MENFLTNVCCFQYTDDKLPSLDYSNNHRVIERSFNNTAGIFPFVTPGEKVGHIIQDFPCYPSTGSVQATAGDDLEQGEQRAMDHQADGVW